jgi:cyclophilin family peptidyl-prolyl cis-trans isomerase
VLKLANDSSFLQSTLCTTLRGSQTISGFVLEDEGFTLKHDVPGLLGAVRKSQARHNNTSDFYITLKKLASFDGKSVIFGRICLGFKDLKRCVKIAP